MKLSSFTNSFTQDSLGIVFQYRRFSFPQTFNAIKMIYTTFFSKHLNN